MNKQELLEFMSKEAKLSKRDAERALDAFKNGVTKALKKGDKVQLVGFGTFQLKKRAGRKGVNPSTGEQIKIKASKVPTLKFGKAYKDLFN